VRERERERETQTIGGLLLQIEMRAEDGDKKENLEGAVTVLFTL
jgi:hypothetical protein